MSTDFNMVLIEPVNSPDAKLGSPLPVWPFEIILDNHTVKVFQDKFPVFLIVRRLTQDTVTGDCRPERKGMTLHLNRNRCSGKRTTVGLRYQNRQRTLTDFVDSRFRCFAPAGIR